MNNHIISRKQAENLGYTVDTCCYPWVDYKGSRFEPDELLWCYTDLETTLLQKIERIRDFVLKISNRHE